MLAGSGCSDTRRANGPTCHALRWSPLQPEGVTAYMAAMSAAGWHHVGMLNFTWTIQVGRYPVNFLKQGDEWIDRLGSEIPSRMTGVQVTGHKFDQTTTPFVLVTISTADETVDESLLFAATTTDLIVHLAGDNEPNEDRLERFREAAEIATTQLGDEGDEHHWTAIIGHPAERLSGSDIRLESDIQVGPFLLESSGTVFQEPGSLQGPSYAGWTIRASMPIRVHGANRGFNWDAASLRAARDLRLLSALLSVAWQTTLIVRESPAPLDWGIRTVPEHSPWHAADSVSIDTTNLPGRGVEGSSWLSSAWARASSEDYLQAALDIYLEGASAEPFHPSLAAVAYTACVETVAGRLYKLERCKTCKTPIGNAKSFRAAIRLVLPEEEARILDPVYGARSTTVHAGRLHGEETVPGAVPPGIWSDSSTHDFRWRTLWNLRGAASRLLAGALRGELPPKASLPTSP